MKYTDKVQCINLNTKQIKYFNENNIPDGFVIRKGSGISKKNTSNNSLLKLWSKKVRDRDGFKCQVCGRTDITNAHHILCKECYPEFKFEIDNGITLCPYHHKFGKLSAHRNQLWFSEWLKENFNDLWKLAIQRLKGSER